MPDNNALIAALMEVAKDFTAAMAEKVIQNRLPQKINDSTSIGTVKSQGSTMEVDVVIDTSEQGAPMAGAFEWGSGLHRTRGTPSTYPITPRFHGSIRSSVLAIPRSRWPNYEPPPDVDPVILLKVNHPGVVARPYIVPTIEEQIPNMKEKLGKAFKVAVLSGTEPVTTIEVKI